LLTTRFTLAWEGRSSSALGRCEITLSRDTFEENLRFTLPTEQCALLIAARARLSRMPTTLGTRQRAEKVAVTERSRSIVSVHVPEPEQPPPQPEKTEA